MPFPEGAAEWVKDEGWIAPCGYQTYVGSVYEPPEYCENDAPVGEHCPLHTKPSYMDEPDLYQYPYPYEDYL